METTTTQTTQTTQQDSVPDSTLLKLVSNDEQEFEVTYGVAKLSMTIFHMIEDLGGQLSCAIPLPNVSGKAFAKILEYMKYHHENPVFTTTDLPGAKKPENEHQKEVEDRRTDNILEWDQKFCEVEQAFLFELILAANYLDIKPLLDLTCKTVANMIKGKKPEEIRKAFNITTDFTPDEEEQIKKENEWCEEKVV